MQKSAAWQHIVLQSSFEVVAVRAILFDHLVTVCSMYISPDERFDKIEFEKMVDQLPEPYVIIGDFNAHSTLWGDSRCDARGRAIENFLLLSGACLFNKAEPTYYSTTHNTYSCIDLAIGSPSLLPYLEWKVNNNPYGSDHFPTLLETRQWHERPAYPKKWNLRGANWVKYRELCTLRLEEVDHLSVEELASYITEYILNSANKCIPQSSANKNNAKPWWNEDCENAKKCQNKAWSIFSRYPTVENLINFKSCKANGRRIRRIAKRESWTRYISSINSYTDARKVYNRVHKLKGQHPLED